MKNLYLFLLILGVFSESFSQWSFQSQTPANLCQANDFQYAVAYSADSLGNTYYAWQDYRNGKIELFAQKLDAKGKIQWDKDGIKIGNIIDKYTFIYTPKFIKPDQNGGAWIAWHNAFDTDKPEKRKIFLQHLTKDGKTTRNEQEILLTDKASLSYDPNDGVFDLVHLNNNSFLMIYNIFDSEKQSNQIFTQIFDQEGKTKQQETLLLDAKELDSKVLFDRFSSRFFALIKNKEKDYLFQVFNQNQEAFDNPKTFYQDEVIGNSRIDYFQSDNLGNVFIGRTLSVANQKKVFAHKLDKDGYSIWKTMGVAITENQSYDIQIAPLSDGGGICTWIDTQDKSMPFQFARINHKGDFIWKKAVFTPRSDKNYFLPNKLISDGKDGIYTLWFKPKNIGYDLTIQHFDINGEPLFHEDGVAFEAFTFYSDYRLILHPKNGVVVMWGANQELEDGVGKSVNLYTHYISETGQLGFENPPKISFQTQSNTTFCPGQQTILNFSTDKVLDLENIYTVYLSDSVGQFVNKTKLGSGISQAMNVKFPKNLSTGKYRLYVSSSSPEADSDTLLIDISKLTKPNITADTNAVCAGGKITLKASSCSNGNIRWSNGLGENPQTIRLNKTETFTATCTANGCESSESSNSVMVEAKILITVNASNGGPYIQGSLVKFNSTIQSSKSPFTFEWSGPNNFTSSIQNPMILNAQTEAAGTYTVKISDSTGCFGMAQTEVIIQQILANEFENIIFNVFPNPAQNIINIQTQGRSIQNISIIDTQGRIWWQKPTPTKQDIPFDRIDSSGFPAGVYIIQIESDKQKLLQKVIVNN